MFILCVSLEVPCDCRCLGSLAQSCSKIHELTLRWYTRGKTRLHAIWALERLMRN